MPEYTPQSSNGAYFLLGLIFFILILMGIVFYFYQDIKDKFFNSESVIKSNIIEYSIRVTDENTNEVEARYEISQDGSVLRQQGLTKIGVLEKFSNAINTSNYTISAWNDNYYINTTFCELQKKECFIQVKKIANPIFLKSIKYSETEYQIQIKPTNGSIFNTILCSKWQYDIKKINVKGINKTTIPSQFLNDFDECFIIEEGYLSDLKNYDIVVEKDETVFNPEGKSKFEITIIDVCNTNRENIFTDCAPNQNLEFTIIW